MNKFLSLLFVLFSLNTSIAQIETLRNNPNIVWLAESFSICSQGENRKFIEARFIDSENVLMKYIHEEGFNNFSNSLDSFFSFKQIMLDLLKESAPPIYQEHYLESKATPKDIKELKLKDSVIAFDPETFEEIKRANIEGWQPKDILYFKIKQLIYYDKKAKEIQSVPIAVAPIVRIKGILLDLFWLPVKTKTKIKFQDKNLQWINRTTYNVFTDEAEIVKEDISFLDIWNDLYADMKDTSSNHRYYLREFSRNSNFLLNKIPNEIIAELRPYSVDTIITFDPETFAEIVQVYKSEVTYDFFEGIKLFQDWAWDEKRKQLIIVSKGFAPIYSKILINGAPEVLEKTAPYIIKLTN